ncbi:hypothetical protein A2415_00865 [candidate division WWE3 bacterium RIFOXYC1_FULL_39_7]|uniref:Uncharacterized protein n=2 Tax=Katanobacteria TaxID=422282 RepID=A0A1F4X710_UNCKA|nr:MAG: hypothetical protein A2415_00865 [candidate division WWE3 bacterium RIFOXYC1_FULL_39_7]OGC77457.1 MAG: hypothetical protein A2619_03865 [candidate division WWE3 bacterium RIFOXYD1_FULL_39_9]
MSLTQSAHNFKKGAKIFAVVLVVYYLFILFIIPRGQDLVDLLTANKEPPNPEFGILDPLKFTRKPINDPPPRYTLNTKDGKLPRKIPNKMLVYRIKPAQFSFQAGKEAMEDAVFIGFREDELTTDLKADVYKWRSLVSGGILEIDTKTRSLKMETDLYGRFSEFKAGSLNEDTAKRFSKELFTKINRFDDKLYVEGEQVVHLGRYIGNNITEARNLPEVQLARVDFFREINGYPILGPDPTKGLLSTVLRNPVKTSSPFNYPRIEAYYWEINPESTATYPIITVEDAWAQVQQGNGIISNVTPKGANVFDPYAKARVENILVDNIYLAYYETPEYMPYLQPMFVFSGKYTTKNTEGGDVTLYYPAISGEYTKSVESDQ